MATENYSLSLHVRKVCKVLISERKFGTWGEDMAAKHLESLGLQILCRNFRTRLGEIDIVAQDGDVTAFVEVKARRPGALGSAKEQITPRKQRRILSAALAYVALQGEAPAGYRFDVVAIDVVPGEDPRMELIKGAFDAWG